MALRGYDRAEVHAHLRLMSEHHERYYDLGASREPSFATAEADRYLLAVGAELRGAH